MLTVTPPGPRWLTLRLGPPCRALVVLVAWSLVLASGCSDGDVPANASSQTGEMDDDELRRQLDHVLDFTFEKRRLNVREHAAWQIIHGAVAFRRDFLIYDRQGELVSAVDYALQGGEMNGWTLQPGTLFDEAEGRRGVRAVLESGSKTGQGHPDQWLGYLSACGLPPDEILYVEGEPYRIEDWVEQIEWDVPRNPVQEYSWTLMALTAYRPTDYRWTASDGNEWSIDQLVDLEAEQDLGRSACGGTHRLVGLTMALNRHLQRGGKLEGAWERANERIEYAIDRARKFQNPDGSFSSNYFERPGTTSDAAQALGTTGHTLEFLVLALPDEQFQQPWVRRAAVRLCDLFRKTEHISLECGALYHSASGLVLYRARAFGERPFPAASSAQ